MEARPKPLELQIGDMKLEVVVVPVSDVDRAKHFYEMLGFRMDIDYVGDHDFRVVQLTPPGSEASIVIGSGITSAAPGSVEALQLTGFDIEAARAQLVERVSPRADPPAALDAPGSPLGRSKSGPRRP